MKSLPTFDETIRAALALAIDASQLTCEPAMLVKEDLDEIAEFLAGALSVRRQNEVTILVDGAASKRRRDKQVSSRRTRIAVINQDMPFLVDSISGCLVQQDLAINLMLHPVVSVARDRAGSLIAVGEIFESEPESVIYIETDDVGARGRIAVEDALRRTLGQVGIAVEDWRDMVSAVRADISNYEDRDQIDRWALLPWLLQGNFTHLGHEKRDRLGAAHDILGICRTTDEPLLSSHTVQAALTWFENGNDGPLILKSNRPSRVHRNVPVDIFATPIRVAGEITGMSIHAGLWTSSALAAAPRDVPILRETLAHYVDRFALDPRGPAGKALVHALTYLPHDVMIALSAEQREVLAMTAVSLGDMPRARLELARGPLNRHLFAFIWLQRDHLTTSRRMTLAALLSEVLGAPVLNWQMTLDESGLALLRLVLDLQGEERQFDLAALNMMLSDLVRGWLPAVEDALADHVGARRAAVLARRYANSFPPAFCESEGAAETAVDILRIHGLDRAEVRDVRLYHGDRDTPGQLRLKVYSLTPLTLSDAVPILENFGFRVIGEKSVLVGENGRQGHIQQLILSLDNPALAAGALEHTTTIEHAITAVIQGHAENDRFNELVIAVQLDLNAVAMLRSIFRYLRQIGSAYGLSTVVGTLRRASTITSLLIRLFHGLHDPQQSSGANAKNIIHDIEQALIDVSGLEDDRILRLYRSFIQAILRTNAFSQSGAEALAFKIDSSKMPDMPSPVPWREIWVHSPRVEGVHLRAGPIARGGLRWSDRRDDFRTEILGLMKAQRIKNAVIVPTGAKGGFFPKQLPDPIQDRNDWLAEGVESYRVFIRALLSVTDNVVGDEIRHPEGIIVRDSSDPYLVVAADKGTSSFSDFANDIAVSEGFWLADAFASGGSSGYDHKVMGITARGAWISVQRHFLEQGIDVQSQPIAVVGVGDMSGDVFGNGMLMSKEIKLVAAFDHRHIFIDPDPDATQSWMERKRLFDMPRSSWADYDASLISKGGGVFSRDRKAIVLSNEICALLGTDKPVMDPTELISALLTAQVDLLWFGGIGTYIKACSQSHLDAGDAANDQVRVDAESVRAKVIGEGANLGITQAGRIAYALAGGRINADFVDNSAGVDCSDKEVNIKIALSPSVVDGHISLEVRNAILAQMTESVTQLVLEDNRLQALGISIAEAGGAGDTPGYIRLIEGLTKLGRLDSKVEELPECQALMLRAQDGKGLTRPELAVLLATAKLTLQDAVANSSLLNDPIATSDLFQAFPENMREDFAKNIAEHQLRPEIVATAIANRIVNRLGPVLPLSLAEEEGFSLADAASAFLVAETLFDLPEVWRLIDNMKASETVRIASFRRLTRTVTNLVREICRLMAGSLSPSEAIAALKPGVDALLEFGLHSDLALPADASHAVANAIARLERMAGSVGTVELARRLGKDVVEVSETITDLTSRLGREWLLSTSDHLSPDNQRRQAMLSGVASGI
ncbi:NAD-glutamate dehydrogenase domain-containing protein [Sphingobium nicotianae]|uniref:NAD-glutamate dehydrogenase n=1 Tax=Sphingobium nicotianae TaxID=2782607 RepID=A0A9X1D9X7_9SPHN|nr:NAD-glutamate dehydrogenase domain-containing protein [Sphingobium nicotianae]MBT2186050.1 NAD-glutamate dehydrogenase [Sphingobium nicotianae]